MSLEEWKVEHGPASGRTKDSLLTGPLPAAIQFLEAKDDGPPDDPSPFIPPSSKAPPPLPASLPSLAADLPKSASTMTANDEGSIGALPSAPPIGIAGGRRGLPPSRRAAEPPSSRAAEPPRSRAAQQLSSSAAAPPSSRAAELPLFLPPRPGPTSLDWADGLSMFDLTSGTSPAPPAAADSTVRSQWATRNAAARLAVRRHLPTTEQAHLSQYRSAHTLYNAVVAPYSSPATAALSRLFLPYLFPDLTAFPTVTDLITHLRTSDTRYRAALPAEFCAKNPPPNVPHPLLHSHPAP
ncbi:unnamed protein product [Closterium sp. NIES-54]